MDDYNLGLTMGKAWRLGHMGEPTWEAGINARKDLHIMEGTHEADSFYEGFNDGVSAVDENAQNAVQEDYREAKTLDGDEIGLWVDPESEPPFQVTLASFGLRIAWEADNLIHARALFDALQHVKVVYIV